MDYVHFVVQILQQIDESESSMSSSLNDKNDNNINNNNDDDNNDKYIENIKVTQVIMGNQHGQRKTLRLTSSALEKIRIENTLHLLQRN